MVASADLFEKVRQRLNRDAWIAHRPAEHNDVFRSMLQKVRDGLYTSTGGSHGSLELENWLTKFVRFDDPAPPNRLHRFLSTRLKDFHTKRGQKLAVLAPRGSAKTTWLTFGYVLEAALTGREKYILIIGGDIDAAKGFIQALRLECENNLELREAYPFLQVQQGRDSHHEWSKYRLHLANGVLIEARGPGKLRGRKHGQARPSLVVLDDPSDDSHKTSAAKRKALSTWFFSTLLKIGNKLTNFLFAGTAVHRECLICEVAKLKTWETVKFKSIEKEPVNSPLWSKWKRILLDSDDKESEIKARKYYMLNKTVMDKGAVVLWPEKESLYDLQLMRVTEGRYSFEAEKQNNPIDPESCEWAADLFEGEHIWFDEWPEDPEVVVASLDPSKGRKDKPGDYQAMAFIALKNNLIYIDADIDRRPIPQMVYDFIANCRFIMPHTAVVESVMFQECLLPECEAEALEQKLPVPIEGIETGGVDKITRIRRLGPWINRRRLRFKRGSAGVKLLIEQLQDFPTGQHDDGPDALEMAVRRALQLLGASVEDESPTAP